MYSNLRNLNILFTEDDIQRWMKCDGPDYDYMDEQGIVALITGDNEKEADEAVKDEIVVSQPSKRPFYHAEAMQKIDDYLAYIVANQKPHLKICQNSSDSVSFLLRNKKDLSNKLPVFLL